MFYKSLFFLNMFPQKYLVYLCIEIPIINKCYWKTQFFAFESKRKTSDLLLQFKFPLFLLDNQQIINNQEIIVHSKYEDDISLKA